MSEDTQAKEILRALAEAGDVGLTKKEISDQIKDKGCGRDCENWLTTFLEAGVIEKCGKKGGLVLYRLTKEGRDKVFD